MNAEVPEPQKVAEVKASSGCRRPHTTVWSESQPVVHQHHQDRYATDDVQGRKVSLRRPSRAAIHG